MVLYVQDGSIWGAQAVRLFCIMTCYRTAENPFICPGIPQKSQRANTFEKQAVPMNLHYVK